MIRVGIGYDIHRLVKGRKLFLGGVDIPFALGLDGHSDADVLLHAICDALLGAAGLGDIGEHFPNTDKKYKNISSLKLLASVGRLISKKGYTVGNIDSVIIAEHPSLKNHKNKMRSRIAEVLHLKTNQVNIKATTQEGLGFGKSKDAMAVYAVAVLKKRGQR